MLVEKNHAALKVIRENLEITGFEEKAIILSMDVFNALNKLSQSAEKFDIIFIDPPYGTGLARKTAAEVLKSGVLGSDGVIVAEYDRYDDLENGETGEAEEAGRTGKKAKTWEVKAGRGLRKQRETGKPTGRHIQGHIKNTQRPYREKKYGERCLRFTEQTRCLPKW